MNNAVLSELNFYLETCEQELVATFGSVYWALQSPDNWTICNKRRTRRLLRRSLKMQGEEKDAFDLHNPWIMLDYLVWGAVVGGISHIRLTGKRYSEYWLAYWKLHDLSRYLQGHAKDYCTILCEMAEIVLTVPEITIIED